MCQKAMPEFGLNYISPLNSLPILLFSYILGFMKRNWS